MDFHWIIGQGGERTRGPPCHAPMIGHYSDFVSRISRSPKQLLLISVSGNTDLLPLEVFSGHGEEASWSCFTDQAQPDGPGMCRSGKTDEQTEKGVG